MRENLRRRKDKDCAEKEGRETPSRSKGALLYGATKTAPYVRPAEPG